MKLGTYELNQIYNTDCLDGLKNLPDACIDCIITDPPYFLGVTHNGKKGQYSDLAIMKPFFDTLFFQYNRVLKPDGKMYMCCDWRTYPFLYPICEQHLPIKNLIVWNKQSGPGNFYTFTHELIIFVCKNNKFASKGARNIISIPGFSAGAKKTNGEKIHPTQKPIELFEKFITDSTKEKDVILDTFIGSGTLAIAAITTHRNYIGFELQSKYCNIANERIQKFQGNFVKTENHTQQKNMFME
ncbi:methyltransferase [Planctomycetales bacterium]|nr:methyltransferase [Planctomycetales bacterium]